MSSFTRRFQNKLATLSERFPWKQALVVVTLICLAIWLKLTPGGLLGKADAVGYAVCHRIDHRSFHMGERQVPLCARCTGQYLGAMLGLIYMWFFRPRRTEWPSKTMIGILLAMAAIYAVDGVNSYIHLIPGLSRFYLYEPNNIFRVVTGTGLGLGVSVLLYPAFNQTMWKQGDPRPVLEGWRDFGLLLLLGAAIDVLVLTENPLILYPLALVSSTGILILLTLIYSMVTVMVIGLENHFERISQLVYPTIAGFLIALVQIGVLDWIRYGFTGTWGEIPFGF